MIKYLCLALILLATACNNNKTNNEVMPGKNGQTATGNGNGFWEKLEMVELKDGSGLIAAIMPIPSSWKLGVGNGPSITGPNDLKVTDYPLHSFMNNYDPGLQQVYMQSGQQMREMPGIQQLIQQDFVPWGQQQGMQVINFYEIPEVSKIDKWYSDQMFKAMPSRSDIAAFGIDWKKSDGTPYFMLVHINASTSNSMQNWYYRATSVEAAPDHFEAAKKQYIFALANTRYNLEPIAVYNRQEAQRVGQSWAAHNQRMAQNQANFEASQRAFVNKSEAINDAIMSGWRQRNASSDKIQEQTIDGIYERTNAQNTETGQMYKVSAGANQYWMNNNGEYISTKLNDYNPNLDDNMNAVKWQQLREVRKN